MFLIRKAVQILVDDERGREEPLPFFHQSPPSPWHYIKNLPLSPFHVKPHHCPSLKPSLPRTATQCAGHLLGDLDCAHILRHRSDVQDGGLRRPRVYARPLELVRFGRSGVFDPDHGGPGRHGAHCTVRQERALPPQHQSR